MAENSDKSVKKVDAKPDKIDTSVHNIKFDEKDKMLHGMANSDAFKAKYGQKWKEIANGIAHAASHFLRTKRDR